MSALGPHAARLRAGYWSALEFLQLCVARLRARLLPMLLPWQQRRNQGLFALRIDAKVGFFAQLSWCLSALAYCRAHGLRPYLELTGPLYARTPGQDWLGDFFDRVNIEPADRARIASAGVRISTVTDIEQAGLQRVPKLSLEEAHALMTQHLLPKKSVTDHVDAFVAAHFAGHTVLGLHYRGTDKNTEAERVTWDRCRDVVLHYLRQHPEVTKVFVASDEHPFVEWITSALVGHAEVVAHEDDSRSSGSRPVHIDPFSGDNAAKGWDALVNCLLLARCDVLVRTASFLSSWSLIFNPKLPVIVLNKPFADKLWFPDDAVAERSMNQYLQIDTPGPASAR